MIRRRGGLESASGRAAKTLQTRRRPTVRQDSQRQAGGLGATRAEGPRSLRTGSTWTGTEGRNPRWPLAPRARSLPAGSVLPQGLPYAGASTPAEGREHTSKVSAHIDGHTTHLRVWGPSSCKECLRGLALTCAVGCLHVSQPRGWPGWRLQLRHPHCPGALGESPLAGVPWPWPSSPSSFPPQSPASGFLTLPLRIFLTDRRVSVSPGH